MDSVNAPEASTDPSLNGSLVEQWLKAEVERGEDVSSQPRAEIEAARAPEAVLAPEVPPAVDDYPSIQQVKNELEPFLQPFGNRKPRRDHMERDRALPGEGFPAGAGTDARTYDGNFRR